MTTLDVLAAEVGVSPATVSRALRGKNGVSEAVRQRVLAAAEAAGYVANKRSTGIDTDVVGLVVPELDNPVFPAFASALTSGFASHSSANTADSRCHWRTKRCTR